MTRKLTLTIIICFIFSFAGVSQQDKATKISIFKPADSVNTVTAAEKQKLKQENHCLKWSYTLLARGVFLLNYEKPFHKMMSVEVGLGVTYRDFIFELYRGEFTYGDMDNAKFGFAAEGGVRLYPQDFNDFEGFFISPIISYRTYTIPGGMPSSYGTPTTPSTASSFKQGYNLLDFQFKIGYAYESLWDWDMIGEFYAGVAIRNATMRYYQETTNTVSGGYTYVPTTKTIKVPQFIIGFKFGVPF